MRVEIGMSHDKVAQGGGRPPTKEVTMADAPIVPLTPAQVAAQERQAAQEPYLKRDAVGFDQLVNVLTDGNPDETISSRMARWATEGTGLKRDIGVAVSKALNLAQPDHGAKAEAGDLERAQKVVSIERAADPLT